MRSIFMEKQIPRIVLTKALHHVWHNVIYSGIAPLFFDDIPEPDLPSPHWIRVQNRLCGICATDLMFVNLDFDPRVGAAALPGIQTIYLGHEVVGHIVETGPGVQSLQVGDRVIMRILRLDGPTCFSQEIEPLCYACAQGNYSLCANTSVGVGPYGIGGGWGDGYIAHETEVLKVPDDLSDDQAVMVEPLAVAVRTVLRRVPAAGDKILVVGSGMVGLNVIMALRAFAPDCHISAMARYPQQIEMARQLGADEIITGQDGYEATARITGAKIYDGMLGARMALGGFDFVYDCVGSAKTLERSLRWARAGGTVVMAGVTSRPLKLDLLPIWYQEVDLIGLNSHGAETWQGNRISDFELAIEMLQQGKFSIDGLITHRFPLERWREAIQTAQDKRTGAIRVIFDYGMV